MQAQIRKQCKLSHLIIDGSFIIILGRSNHYYQTNRGSILESVQFFITILVKADKKAEEEKRQREEENRITREEELREIVRTLEKKLFFSFSHNLFKFHFEGNQNETSGTP